MGDELEMLEKRIEKAIAFIEDFKNREKRYLEEKREYESRIAALKEELERKENIIEDLRRSQRYLKEKIETILDKLESIELVEDETSMNIQSPNLKNPDNGFENTEENTIFKENASIVPDKIIEEKEPVDLKELKYSEDSSKESEEETKEDDMVVDTGISGEEETSGKAKEENVSGDESEGKKDLELIDGGIADNNPETKKESSKKESEGFLFNSDNKLKGDWFSNNPFIEM